MYDSVRTAKIDYNNISKNTKKVKALYDQIHKLEKMARRLDDKIGNAEEITEFYNGIPLRIYNKSIYSCMNNVNRHARYWTNVKDTKYVGGEIKFIPENRYNYHDDFLGFSLDKVEFINGLKQFVAYGVISTDNIFYCMNKKYNSEQVEEWIKSNNLPSWRTWRDNEILMFKMAFE